MPIAKKLSELEFNSLMSDILDDQPINDLLDKYKIKIKTLHKIIYGQRYRKWWGAYSSFAQYKIRKAIDSYSSQHENGIPPDPNPPKPCRESVGFKRKIILSYECEYIEALDDDKEKIKQKIEANGLNALIEFANSHYSKAINAWVTME